MKSIFHSFLLVALLAATAVAAEVDTQISTRETFVGRPVVLQISVVDAADYQEPVLPNIDGCDIQSLGRPREMSQVTVINGRRSESRSAVLQYHVTPREEGTFVIPALELTVDGKPVATKPQRFVASKSETGDLMFVEIDGDQKQVYVGEPLDLTLKIWVKPFRDPATGQTLSEGDMWSTISASTLWGGFSDQVETMKRNRQRPRGEEVLRDDGTGHERSYYLYRIEATVYPKRAGSISADDVQIVVDYPTALGQARSPFGRSFADDFFGGRSPFSSMMDDDLFGAPFGRGLAITESRPIIGEVAVDATEVLPVPTEGRPHDYRGAVGQYQIVTRATPTTVDAGDPITLNIGIRGTGPMELVQAPPLSTLPELTEEFKVPDESLAGFVEDDMKVFSTTIRPRQAGVEEIPPIRFSFFNPDTKEFETVMSDPIAITVAESETLALDSIVSSATGSSPGASQASLDRHLPNFTNDSGPGVLETQSPRSTTDGWWALVVVPPLVWIIAVVVKYWSVLRANMPSFRSPRAACLAAIERAQSADDVQEALVGFILKRSRVPANDPSDESVASATRAVGALRLIGLYHVASEAESFLLSRHAAGTAALETSAATAKTLVERVDHAISANKRSRVKRKRLPRPANGAMPTTMHSSRHGTTSLMGAILITCIAAATSLAGETAGAPGTAPQDPLDGKVENATTVVEDVRLALTFEQQQTLLSEATEAYELGLAKSQSDSADAKELLAAARTKYQMLIDSGIRNAELYTNLANAEFQTGQLGRAIAHYENALLFDPANAKARTNLAFADAQVQRGTSVVEPVSGVRGINNQVVNYLGRNTLIWLLAVSSIAFWGVLTIRVFHRPFPVWSWAAVPFVLLIISLGSVVLTESNPRLPWNAVIVSDTVNLHAGDGTEFETVVNIDAAQGHRVEVMNRRGNWSQIRTSEGQTGWLPDKDLQTVSAT